MENGLKHALGDRPNSEFILDPTGKIVVLRDWSNPESLRADLEKLVGPVDNPTPASRIKLKTEAPSRPAHQQGVVKRPEIPAQLRPVKVTPQSSKEPYYVKLRVEVEPDVIGKGDGKIYLGFHLDPIHKVHWNNLAAPMEYEITGLSQKALDAPSGQFAKVSVQSDVDPREFVLTARNLKSPAEFRVEVKYFACSDTEGWCKPVSQQYLVSLESDRDAGSARRGERKFAGRPGENRGRPGSMSPNRGGRFTVERFMSHDRNQDGKVSLEEMPPPMQRIIQRADSNGDKAIDREEAEWFEKWMKRRGASRKR
ncbi:MAG: EF-hand domain-containing protein [Planctomycetota bacterium]|nr:EF-hand domain-containing protein [Planctomycetota bacterium]